MEGVKCVCAPLCVCALARTRICVCETERDAGDI